MEKQLSRSPLFIGFRFCLSFYFLPFCFSVGFISRVTFVFSFVFWKGNSKSVMVWNYVWMLFGLNIIPVL